MKNILLVLALVFSISIQAQDNSEFKTETIEFIKLTGATKAFEDVIDQIGGMVSQANKEAYKTEAKGTLTGLYDKLADLYMREFTQSEIKEMVKFYRTDVGKKLASKQLLLAQSAMMMGQSWGAEVQAIAQKYN